MARWTPAPSFAGRFFELGGQSPLAAELFARLETVHGVRLPLASPFPGATIERQAHLSMACALGDWIQIQARSTISKP